MAELSTPKLIFDGSCPDPGYREVDLPDPLPEIGDDFDWYLRDYDSLRDAMLAELTLRFPERRSWTGADMEVVLLEVAAAVLDQLSDMADRVAAESYLESARRPESVFGWLSFIGLDLEHLFGKPRDDLVEHWRANPQEMEAIRREGPSAIRTQKRMVSLRDYALRLEEHPLVMRAQANRRWGGAWPVVWVTVSLWNDVTLADGVVKDGELQIPPTPKKETDDFHESKGFSPVEWVESEKFRDILLKYVTPYRSIGQEVFLIDVEPVGVDLSFCLNLEPNYFQSEVFREARRVLGRDPGGFFEPGRLKFGEDLHVSDFYETLMSLDGVDTIDVTVFKKVGNLHSNRAIDGLITLAPDEVAVCDDDYFRRERGTLKIALNGGRRG